MQVKGLNVQHLSLIIEDEASPFNYLHVFIVSLYFNLSFDVMNVRFNSIS
jgi:hypothetical protein